MAPAVTSSLAWLYRALPFLSWMGGVRRETLKDDLMAGVTNAFVVLPQGVAFAMIAGLPPEYGLYTAIIPPIIAGLFGSSMHLISGPTTAISIVVFSTVSPYAEPGTGEFIALALTLTLLAGLFQFALGVARMGAVVNFISHTVVIGFTAGAAILIATSQLKHCLGVDIPKGESFLNTWVNLYHALPETNPYAVAVALLTLVVVAAVKKVRPRWPAMLFGMIAGGVLALLLGGAEREIRVVGSLPSHLPPFSVPDFSIAAIRDMSSGAMAVAMLGLIEAISIARSIATKSRQRIDGNQEFIGQGLSNIVGSFFSCYASSGSFTRSGINYAAGAKTPLAAVSAALSLAMILFFVAPLAAYLPIPAMGGIVLLVAYNLIDFHHIRAIMKASKAEYAVLLITFFATLFVKLEFAIYVGVISSLLLYLNKTAKPTVLSRVPDPKNPRRAFTTDSYLPECPQFKIIRIDGSLYFGSVNHVARALMEMDDKTPMQIHALIVSQGINFIDVAGMEMIMEELERRRAKGGDLYFYRLKGGVLSMLERGGYLKTIGEENLFRSKEEAIRTIVSKLDDDVCRSCSARIFLDCAGKPYDEKLAAAGPVSIASGEGGR